MLQSALLAIGLLLALQGDAAGRGIVEDRSAPESPGFDLVSGSDGATWHELPSVAQAEIWATGSAIVLETTTLAQVQDMLGGDVHHNGDAGGSTYWLCYRDNGSAATGPTLVWFQSSGEMGGREHAVTGVAVEVAPPIAPAGCTVPTESLAFSTNMPGIGAAPKDLARLFGSAVPDNATVAYWHEAPNPNATMTAFTTWRSFAYRTRAGRVVALQFEQITSN